MGFLLSLFAGFTPMFIFAAVVYWLDRYEKEPKILLGGVFLWGSIVAAGGAFLVNTLLGASVFLFTQSEFATELTTGSVIAPFVEESLKGLAVLAVFLLFRSEFDSVLDGIVYAAIAALGFAATENTFYIYTRGYQESGFQGLLWLVFVRVFLVGWQHPFYTAFIGIGLALARMSRGISARLFFPLAGWTIALFTHSFHNTVASLASGAGGLAFGTLLDWGGWFIIFLVVLWAISREQQWIRLLLQEEVDLGVITAAQYRTAGSAWSQSAARLSALFTGSYGETARFYQLCGELAHKKRQRRHMGEEDGNTAAIERLRSDLARLSARARHD